MIPTTPAGLTAFDEFVPLLQEWLKDPPDPYNVPDINKKGAVMGLLIPFHVLSWIFVFFRLHTRLFAVKQPGLDDLFVVIAAVFNLLGMVGFIMGLEYGLGKHLIYILTILEPTMIWFYIASASYTTTTLMIKLSLLFQYKRLFRDGYRRILVLAMLVIVVIWGSVFCFMAWFPCFPVRGFWDKYMSPPAKCYGFGYGHYDEVKNTLLAQSGSNMCLDFMILFIPLTEYFKPRLHRKQVLAMTGLFAFGSLVVLMAALRLHAGLINRSPALKGFDFTFWLPKVLVYSCLEIDFAIMCASMPIFWPTIRQQWTQIFVTQEVSVTRDRRSALVKDRDKIELDFGLERSKSAGSWGSMDGLAGAAKGMDVGVGVGRMDSVDGGLKPGQRQGKNRNGKSWFVEDV